MKPYALVTDAGYDSNVTWYDTLDEAIEAHRHVGFNEDYHVMALVPRTTTIVYTDNFNNSIVTIKS